MKKASLALLFASVLTACQLTQSDLSNETKSLPLPDGIVHVETIQGEVGKTIIPYSKYQLDNGLTLILHQDKSDPLVHVDVTYHVGSAREEIGKSGFAHFFEHMMFQGSEHVADEAHFKIITEAGGRLNGTTNSDRTNYFETVPANQLEKVLWLEADRMGFLLNAVTQEKFEVQRETVKNERGERIDNRPYGRLGETAAAALYPEGHPYSWPVIGFMEDLDRVDVNDLKAFFLRWYGPNNATLTIGGDIDEAKTLAMVNKYFGAIPQGPEVAMPEKPAVTLSENRYVTLEDNINQPLLYITFPTVSGRHQDEAPLDLLSEIIGGGKTSLLYKNLVKTQFASRAGVSHPCSELACTFNLYTFPHRNSGKSLAELEQMIRDTFTEFEKRGVEEDDLLKAKAKMESNVIFGLQSVSGKVSQLAANQTFTGNPNYIEQEIARYANVQAADVMRVYEKYIKGQNTVVVSVVPNGKPELAARVATYKTPPRTLSAQTSVRASDLALREAKDDFDRSLIPSAQANKVVDVPDMWHHQLTNGIEVLGSQSTETPTTSILLKIKAGDYYNSKDKAGVASLVAEMLNESTTERSAEEMSKALQKLGARVGIYTDDHYLKIHINTLTKHLNQTMALVKERLTMPAFEKSAFERVKSNNIQHVINSKKRAGYLASVAYDRLMFGDTIAGLPGGGTEKSLANITLSDVKNFYHQQVKPNKGQLIVVSDLSAAQVKDSLSMLESWKGSGAPLKLEVKSAVYEPGVVYLVNKKRAAQSAIRIGKRGLKKDMTGEFYKTSLMNYPLGGAFNSRINLNLREDKGYTYGARSHFWGDKLTGTYTASAEVRKDVTDKSIVEFVNEINKYHREGIAPEELEFMRKAINQSDALKYETPRAKLSFLAQILEYDISPDFVDTRAEIVKTITADEINALAKKHLNLSQMVMVVVGDAKILEPQLKALGYKIEHIEI